jgi:predicted O-linked N-acetylglucosamine transferase (SPINDLY family)
LWPLIEHRDRSRFEVVCFGNVEQPDAVTQRYRASVDEWHDIFPMSDEEVAQLIRNQRIDVVVDLTGHTNGSRLLALARKPAPVQMTYLGYPDTTGMTAVDYRLTDAITDPPGAEKFSVETILRVPGCFLCYPLSAELPEVSEPPAKSNGFITFGSFNNLAKISPTTIGAWGQVLRAVPSAKMVIKTTTFGDKPTAERAAKRFADQGLPMDRVQLAGPTRKELDHVAQYRMIDIALDTFPYTGTTTTCEALAMGVPVVSRFGSRHASRVALSVLTAAGHPEWVTDDPDRFVQIAAELAADVERLATLRAGMRDQLRKSTLCDAKSFAPKVEALYRQAWERWCRG